MAAGLEWTTSCARRSGNLKRSASYGTRSAPPGGPAQLRMQRRLAMFASRSKAAAVDPAHELPRPAEPAPSPSPLGTQTLQRSLGNGYLQAGWTGAGKGEIEREDGAGEWPVAIGLDLRGVGGNSELRADIEQHVERMAADCLYILARGGGPVVSRQVRDGREFRLRVGELNVIFRIRVRRGH